MLSTNLILAGILAAALTSADVPLSAQHDAAYTMAESVGISGTRSLRVMTEPTALDGTSWTTPTHQTKPYATSTPTYQTQPYTHSAGSPPQTARCNSIIGNGSAEPKNGNQLLEVIVSIGADSIQACCNECANTKLCIAFNLQSFLITNVCVLARSRARTAEGQSGSSTALTNIVNANLFIRL